MDNERNCTNCNRSIPVDSRLCPYCGNILNENEQNISYKDDSSKSELLTGGALSKTFTKVEKKRIVTGAAVIVGLILICLLFIVVPGIVTDNIPGGGQNPEVTMEDCNGHTAWDISKGYYATFDTSVENTGNGWAVGCYAKILVHDQSGEVEYDNIIFFGTQKSNGVYLPMKIGERHAFSFIVDYEMGDRSLTATIQICWNNKDGNNFTNTYSKILYL